MEILKSIPILDLCVLLIDNNYRCRDCNELITIDTILSDIKKGE